MEWLRGSESCAMLQKGKQHVPVVVSSAYLESLEEQIGKPVFGERWRVAKNVREPKRRPEQPPRLSLSGLCSRTFPGMTQHRAIPTMLIRGLVDKSINSSTTKGRIHAIREHRPGAQPVEKLCEPYDHITRLFRILGPPTQVCWVHSGRAVERSGVEPLTEVREKLMGVLLVGICLQIFEKKLYCANDLPHPSHASVMGVGDAVVQERPEFSLRR
jgi:hypothetical protein